MKLANWNLTKTIHIQKKNNMAEKLDPKEIVTPDELIYSNMITFI